jgi:hypothetical protein
MAINTLIHVVQKSRVLGTRDKEFCGWRMGWREEAKTGEGAKLFLRCLRDLR